MCSCTMYLHVLFFIFASSVFFRFGGVFLLRWCSGRTHIAPSRLFFRNEDFFFLFSFYFNDVVSFGVCIIIVITIDDFIFLFFLLLFHFVSLQSYIHRASHHRFHRITLILFFFFVRFADVMLSYAEYILFSRHFFVFLSIGTLFAYALDYYYCYTVVFRRVRRRPAKRRWGAGRQGSEKSPTTIYTAFSVSIVCSIKHYSVSIWGLCALETMNLFVFLLNIHQ